MKRTVLFASAALIFGVFLTAPAVAQRPQAPQTEARQRLQELWDRYTQLEEAWLEETPFSQGDSLEKAREIVEELERLLQEVNQLESAARTAGSFSAMNPDDLAELRSHINFAVSVHKFELRRAAGAAGSPQAGQPQTRPLGESVVDQLQGAPAAPQPRPLGESVVDQLQDRSTSPAPKPLPPGERVVDQLQGSPDEPTPSAQPGQTPSPYDDGFQPPATGAYDDGFQPPATGAYDDGFQPPATGAYDGGFQPPATGAYDDGYRPAEAVGEQSLSSARLTPFAREMLAVHNSERARFGYQPLRWNPALVATATAYAHNLARTGQLAHASREGRGIERENLSKGLLGWNTNQLVASWVAERKFFRPGVFPDVSTTGKWYDVGHYTQMIWPQTTDIGCGVAQGSGFSWLVCRYSPGGNKDGKPVGIAQPTR